jgi:hypothetical protein
MRVTCNTLLLLVIGAFVLFLDANFGARFFEWVLSQLGNTSTVYLGFFDLITASQWIPILFLSFIGGLCLCLLVNSSKPAYWGLALGIVVALYRLSSTHHNFGSKATLGHRIYVYFKYVWYPVGAYLGALAVQNAKSQLTHGSTGSLRAP